MNAATTIPVYAKMKITSIDKIKIDISIENINLGQIPIPSDKLKASENTVNKLINNFLINRNIIIEKFELNNDTFSYIGTIPSEFLSQNKK
jgi:hypothetical protein